MWQIEGGADRQFSSIIFEQIRRLVTDRKFSSPPMFAVLHGPLADYETSHDGIDLFDRFGPLNRKDSTSINSLFPETRDEPKLSIDKRQGTWMVVV